LRAGDCLLLEGQIGAGKSHFARAFIQARLGRAEDVPSPTFTLVQSYQADVEIWHADLYRLSHPDEVLELGLDEAFDSAICLIEWPDRLGSLLPKGAMRLRFALAGEGRRVAFLPGLRADLAGDLAKDWADYE
jgi:tRNA threonylcarbamoyladenosine biosynthesis protein TsaE